MKLHPKQLRRALRYLEQEMLVRRCASPTPTHSSAAGRP
jgi:hypothetical protein